MQTHVFLLKRLNDFIMCPLLKLVQGVQLDHFFLLFIQPSDFVIVDFENLLINSFCNSTYLNRQTDWIMWTATLANDKATFGPEVMGVVGIRWSRSVCQ